MISKKMSSLVLGLILILSLVPIITGSSKVVTGWENEGIYGGRVNCLLIDSASYNDTLGQSTTLYIGTQTGDKLFKSTDAGQTWQKIGPVVNTTDGEELRFNPIWTMIADPNDTKTIYVADHGLHKTTDGGTTWITLLKGGRPDVQNLAIDPVNPQIIYVVGAGGENWQPCVIRKSEDGGNSWSELTTIDVTCHPDLVSDFMLHPNNHNLLFLALLPGSLCPGGSLETPGGVLQIDANDGDWEWVLGNSLNFGVFDITFSSINNVWYAATTQGIYKSIDGGVSWSLLKDFGDQVLAVAVGSDGGIYAGVWEQGIYKSNVNNDTEWMLTGFNLDLFEEGRWECRPRIITIDPNNPEILYVCSPSLIFKSQDSGNTWVSITQGITASKIFDIEKYGETFYACAENGLYQRTGENEWNLLIYGRTGEFIDLAIDPVDPKRMVLSMPNHGKPSIMLTENGGENWQYIVIPIDYGKIIHGMSIIVNSGTIYLAVADIINGTDGGVLKGTKNENGSYIWEVVSENYFPHTPVNVLAMDPENPNVLYAGIGAFQYRYSPGGIWKTEDGGQTWENVSNGLPAECVNSIIINPNNSQILLIAVGNKIYKSTDGGSSWIKVKEFEEFGGRITSLAFNNSEVIYAAVSSGMKSEIFRSTDGGESWTLYCTIDYQIFDMLIDSLYVATNGGLWRYVAPTTHAGERITTTEETTITTNWWLIGGVIAGVAMTGTIIYLAGLRKRRKSSKPLRYNSHFLNHLTQH